MNYNYDDTYMIDLNKEVLSFIYFENSATFSSSIDESLHQCGECGRRFRTVPKLEAHMLMHKASGILRCKICHKVMNSAANFRTHLKKHTGKNLQECSVCPTKILHKESLTDNAKLHQDNNPSSCGNCRTLYYSQSKLKQHMSTTCQKSYTCLSALKEHEPCHLNLNYQGPSCKMCDKIFHLQKHLSQHLKVHVAIKLHQYRNCKDTFVKSSDLQEHSKTHPEGKHFMCGLCSKSFYTKRILDIHEQIHSKEMPHFCELCKTAFMQKYDLETHIRTHISETKKIKENSDKPSTCSICDHQFAWKNIFDMHMQLKHSSESPPSHECLECGKTFKYKSNYNYHTKFSSNGNKYFACDFCSKEFTRQSCLREHGKTHLDGLYRCVSCKKDFRNASSYRVHIVSHKAEKPHTCSTCNKSFKLLCVLRKHMLIHFHEKTHKCGICDKRFRQKSHLTTHMVTHTEPKPFKCDMCGKGFSQKGNLKTHFQTHLRQENVVAPVKLHNCKMKKVSIMDIAPKKQYQNYHLQYIAPISNSCNQEQENFNLIENINSMCTSDFENSVLTNAGDHYDIPFTSFQEITLHTAEIDLAEESLGPELSVFTNLLTLVDANPIEVVTNRKRTSCMSLGRSLCEFYECTLVVGVLKEKKFLECQENEVLSDDITLDDQHVLDDLEPDVGGREFVVQEAKPTMVIQKSTETLESSFTKGLPNGKETEMQDVLKTKRSTDSMLEYQVKEVLQIKPPDMSFSQVTGEGCNLKPQNSKHLARNLNIQLEVCEGPGENVLPQLGGSDEMEESIQAFVLPSEGPELGVMTVNQAENKRHQCQLCCKSYTEKSSLNSHMRLHTGIKPYTCHFCNKAFALSTKYRRHLRSHVDEKPYSCNVCEKRFSQLSNYRAHCVVHRDERPFRCLVCGEDFKLNSVLKRHMMTHTNALKNPSFQSKPEKVDLHTCHYCSKTFKKERQLENHLPLHAAKHLHSCPNCDKVFSLESSLKIHLHSHVENKGHKCSFCSSAFASQSSLKTHLLMHSKNLLHHCDDCNKSFQRVSSYRLHLRRHSGEKPFACEVCNKRFFLKVTLQQHMLIHTGEKPHQCKVCGRNFRQKTHLKIHMVIHTGDKLYKCIVCSKTFSIKTSLKQHMRIHTGEIRHFCTFCKKGFTHLSSYKFHMKKHGFVEGRATITGILPPLEDCCDDYSALKEMSEGKE